jgi:hypothetical protein
MCAVLALWPRAQAHALAPACSLDVQRSLARRTHPHAHWPAVAADDNIDPVLGGDFWVRPRARSSSSKPIAHAVAQQKTPPTFARPSDTHDATTTTTTSARSAQVEARVRAQWLLGLLCLQSLSSFILEANEGLIREHLVITLFLTMLVGAGGNSGA